MGGVNLIYGLGMLDLGMTFSFEQLVIDNEIAGMINRVLYGIPVSDETLGVEVIHKVGPAGTFLGERHTRNFMATEQSVATLFDRGMRSTWNAGSDEDRDVVARANRMVKDILENHKPTPLDSEAADKIKAIIEAAKNR